MIAHIVTKTCAAVFAMNTNQQTRDAARFQVRANRGAIGEILSSICGRIHDLIEEAEIIFTDSGGFHHCASSTVVASRACRRLGNIRPRASNTEFPIHGHFAGLARGETEILKSILNLRRPGLRPANRNHSSATLRIRLMIPPDGSLSLNARDCSDAAFHESSSRGVVNRSLRSRLAVSRKRAATRGSGSTAGLSEKPRATQQRLRVRVATHERPVEHRRILAIAFR